VVYNIDDTKAAAWIKRDMILDRVKLIADEEIAHVVTYVDADL